MTRLWADSCEPTPAWARLAEFATGDAERTSWTAELDSRDGRRLQMLVAPLPDASALVLFRDLSAEDEARDRAGAERAARLQDAALDGLALEQLRIPVEAAVRLVMSAIPSAQSPDSFKGLSVAAQRLKEGLARAGEIGKLAVGESEPDAAGPLSALATALTSRGLILDAPETVAVWPVATRRAAFVLGLAAAEIAAPEASVAVTLEVRDSHRRLVVRVATEGAAHEADRVGAALARRVVEAAGGSLTTKVDSGQAVFAADLPLERPKAPDAAPAQLRAPIRA